jgi:hypothetical protein
MQYNSNFKTNYFLMKMLKIPITYICDIAGNAAAHWLAYVHVSVT